MATFKGLLKGHRVTVLRDSGCNSLIINRIPVLDSKYIKKKPNNLPFWQQGNVCT